MLGKARHTRPLEEYCALSRRKAEVAHNSSRLRSKSQGWFQLQGFTPSTRSRRSTYQPSSLTTKEYTRTHHETQPGYYSPDNHTGHTTSRFATTSVSATLPCPCCTNFSTIFQQTKRISCLFGYLLTRGVTLSSHAQSRGRRSGS